MLFISIQGDTIKHYILCQVFFLAIQITVKEMSLLRILGN